MDFPFTAGFYRNESLVVSGQEAINCYPVVAEVPSLTASYIVGTPGISQLATSGAEFQANRGSHVMAGIAYFVNGGKLWEFTSANALIDRGIIEGGGRVSIADNGYQLLVLAPGGKGYIYNKDTLALVEITDADFRANGDPQHVIFIDGYFLCSTNSKLFIVSSLNDGLSWDALDFGSAESDPDDIVAPAKIGNRLFLLGAETVEEFQNVGGANFPFQRTGLVLPKGCSSPFSIIENQGVLYWVGGSENESPCIWSLAGNSLAKVSTNAVDALLNKLTALEVSTVFSMSYAEKGHFFVVFVLPTTAFVFDSATGAFHERRSYINEPLEAWRVASIVSAYNRTLCGDSIDGRIGELSSDVFTEYGQRIVRRVVAKPFYNEGAAFFLPWLELLAETGVANDECEKPIIELELSRDGKRWANPRARSMGLKGDFRHRIIWLSLGKSSNFEHVRLTMSDPVRFVLIKLVGEILGAQK
jgi:hypothetical protein